MSGLDFFHVVETSAADVMLELCQRCSILYVKAKYSLYVERLRDACFFLAALDIWDICDILYIVKIPGMD